MDPSLPLNLLDKLYIACKAECGEVGAGPDFMALRVAVSTYGKGWWELREAGLVAFPKETAIADAVYFTDHGLRLARSRLLSDKAEDAKVKAEMAMGAPRYRDHPMFGLI